MPSTKIIIPGSKVLENVSASFISNKVVAEVKNKYGSEFPCTLKELDDFFAPKKSKLERHISLSFSKKKDKFRDLMCDLFFDIDGYQAFKGIWHKAFNEALSEVEKAINTLPETMYFSRCDIGETLFLLEDMELDLSIGKYSFNSSSQLQVDSQDHEYNDGWREMSCLEKNLVCSAFVATNIAIDTGTPSCGFSSGFGDMCKDIKYIENTYGLSFAGDYSNYHSVTLEEQSIVIIEAKRPTSIEEVKSEFVKRISLT